MLAEKIGLLLENKELARKMGQAEDMLRKTSVERG